VEYLFKHLKLYFVIPTYISPGSRYRLLIDTQSFPNCYIMYHPSRELLKSAEFASMTPEDLVRALVAEQRPLPSAALDICCRTNRPDKLKICVEKGQLPLTPELWELGGNYSGITDYLTEVNCPTPPLKSCNEAATACLQSQNQEHKRKLEVEIQELEIQATEIWRHDQELKRRKQHSQQPRSIVPQ
jgi:hypothetical protein